MSLSFSSHQENEEVEFYLRLCLDVLFELLKFGSRRRLTKLERLGRRFQWIIEKWFRDVPFLRLDLDLEPTAPGYLIFLSLIIIIKNQTKVILLCHTTAYKRYPSQGRR